MLARAHTRHVDDPVDLRPGRGIGRLHVDTDFLGRQRAQRTRLRDCCASKLGLTLIALLRFALAFNLKRLRPLHPIPIA
jgi:hypothetical protein